jgi:antitoxin ParD1/3/4
MRTAQQFSITLPFDLAEAIDGKIKSGACASVSEVVCDGVRALLERDAAVEQWLRDEVIAGHREYLADPSQGVPAEDVLARIKARRAARNSIATPHSETARSAVCLVSCVAAISFSSATPR